MVERAGQVQVLDPGGDAANEDRVGDGTMQDADAASLVWDSDSGLDGLDSGLASEPPQRLAPGDVLPGTRYRLEQWLGEGGMGVVYECTHLDLDRKVAVKILRSAAVEGSRKPELFRQEARAVSRAAAQQGGWFSHVVEIYDFGELPDRRLWFAMELLRGKNLSNEIKQGPLPAARVIAILRQVCKGLAAAHAAGVVHRDVKPGNVMLLDRGRRSDFVKLVDFGVAAMMSKKKKGGRHQLDGTPAYMAPEQTLGTSFDQRLDVYAVGAMAFHLLTGRPPFVGGTLIDVLQQHQKSPPPRMRAVNPELEVPAALEQVVLRCLEKQPQSRYRNMHELEAALCEAQIDAHLKTPWDDLPVPDVDPRRANAIAHALGRRAVVRRVPKALAIVPLVLLSLVGGDLFMPGAAAREHESEIQRAIFSHVTAARNAAARAFFVYPPPEQPNQPTAYSEVMALEQQADLFGPAALDAATELRIEFADTLVRLGDRYWEREGGRPFAVDYYISALLFVPDHEHARERAIVTPGQLVEFKERAASLEFNEAELRAGEALVALADEDETRRQRRLAKLERSVQDHGAVSGAALRELIEDEGEAKPRPSRRRAARAGAPTPVVEDEPAIIVEEPTVEAATPPPTAAPSGVKSDERENARDSRRSRELATEGLAKLRAGKRTAARQLLHSALNHDNRNAVALDGLARIAFDQGAYGDAVRFAKKAVAIAPQKSDYRMRLGDAYFKVFLYEDARAQYKKALDLGDSAAAGRLKKIDGKLGR